MIGRVQLWMLAAAAGALAFAAAIARAFSRGRKSGKREAEDEGYQFDHGRAVSIRRRVDAARERVRQEQSDRRGYRD